MFGLIALSSFISGNLYVALAAALFMILHAVSVKVDLFYQVHHFLRKKRAIEERGVGHTKDHNESRFASLLGASFLITAFGLHYLGYELIPTILVLMVTFLTFLAGLTGFCVGSIIYVFVKKATG